MTNITWIKSEQNGKLLWKEIGSGVRSLRSEDTRQCLGTGWEPCICCTEGCRAETHDDIKTATRLTACPSVYRLYYSIRRYERGCGKGKWIEVKRRIKWSHGTSMGSYTLCCKFFGELLKGGGSEWGQAWVTTSVSCSGARKKCFIFILCEETKKGQACVTKFHNVEIWNHTYAFTCIS